MVASSANPLLDRLAACRADAEVGGGPRRIDAQHAAGKLTARERIEVLLDEGSFEELDAFVQHRGVDVGTVDSDIAASKIAGDGVVTGSGTISGRTVFVFAKDITVLGGSLSEAHARKICKVQDMALANRAPLIGLFDSEGARIEEGVAALAGYGEIFQRQVQASGIIPQIALIMGLCAGADAFSPALADFIFMVEGSHLFAAGPDVVKAVTNETVTPEALGGAAVHAATSAVADGTYANDVEALLQMRRLVDVLPSSNVSPLPDWPAEVADGDDFSLDSLVPDDSTTPYDIRELIAKIADDGNVFEIQEAFAGNIVTAFGRVEGRTVGFVANQPMVMAGVLDADACRKAARFVRFCDCFAIPLVTLVDVPGFLPGVAAEHGGLVKHGAKLLYAYAEANVPKITLVTRKALGAAYAVMAAKPLRGDLSFAWPTAQIALMDAKGAVAIMFRDEMDNLEKVTAQTKAYADRVLSPYPAAGRGFIDEVIAPHATRRRIARGLAMLRNKVQESAWKKHGNMPL